MATLNELFYKVILANELSNNLSAALRFSDPDGMRTGKSGWSFGVCQFDTQNNPRALDCLRACGFTPAEIEGVVKQTIDVKPLAAKLAANKAIVEQYDTEQLVYCLNSAMNVITSHGVPLESPKGILAASDVVNQYGSIGDGFVAFMKALARPATHTDVLDWRLQTKYGREHQGDCCRRVRNVSEICDREATNA